MLTTILVTGGAGFIGANFIPRFLARHADCRVVTLDKLSYAGRMENLAELADHPRHTFVEGDICDQALLSRLFIDFDLRGVVHFAAESHVDNSISGPRIFIETNIVGSFNLLEAARNHWLTRPGRCRPGYEQCRFHHISTDEVYGSLGADGFFSETTPYAPNSPYSASKASSDFLVRAYFHTYGLPVTTSNCSNNYGPKQHAEKLIPTVIRRALAGEPIPIYGRGSNVRDWLYVLDHCDAIDAVFCRGRLGESYNVGGRTERSNIVIAQDLCAILDQLRPRAQGRYADLIRFVADRPGHDLRYAIDPSKIEQELDWRAHTTFAEGLKTTVEWYLQQLATG